MSTLTMPAPGPEAAYRMLLGHTTTCAACRAGVSCPTAVRLDRAWREARRACPVPAAGLRLPVPRVGLFPPYGIYRLHRRPADRTVPQSRGDGR